VFGSNHMYMTSVTTNTSFKYFDTMVIAVFSYYYFITLYLLCRNIKESVKTEAIYALHKSTSRNLLKSPLLISVGKLARLSFCFCNLDVGMACDWTTRGQ
jgi:hypothetical protein